MAKSTSKRFTIGVLSKHAGVKIETIRYYEKSGILPDPQRTTGGYRSYTNEHLTRLVFIRRCRELGFSMSDIRELLALADDTEMHCVDIHDRTMRHADAIRTKIKHLQNMERTLRKIASKCDGDDAPQCPIIESLQGAGSLLS
ncbi:MAG: MerR family transcriptional regulator [Lysobacteraceae bacterium]|nr:MAG: MerR family transcriptional regulator [Xanthomonadaceae bacterium]